MKRYTIRDFQRDFPTDASCLEWLANYRWPEGIHCDKCNKITKHHPMISRRSLSCQNCGHHVHPTADTIFHKSATPLTLWFYAVYLMAQTRGGISAKQIERETGVTYKTAWRMCKLIRERLDEDSDPMSGKVEIDESYFGGRRPGKRGRGAGGKTPVMGMVERDGRIKAVVVPDTKARTMLPIIDRSIEAGTIIYTDEYRSYNGLGERGFDHSHIKHSAKVYVSGDVHTNTIEGFWGLIKRGISGVYHHVNPKYLQRYVNEYSFRYNHRNDEQPMFLSFLERVGMKAALRPF